MNNTKHDEKNQHWKYDAGDNRHKHHWKNNYAGFENRNSEWIGKCPKKMTGESAEKLLNDGIPVHNPRNDIGCPNEIFNVHEGVIYRAVPTLPGKSYHAFPEINMPLEIEIRLLRRAGEKGCRKELQKWLKKYRKLIRK